MEVGSWWPADEAPRPRLLIEHVRDELRQQASSPENEWGRYGAIVTWLKIQADNLDEALASLSQEGDQ